MEQILNEIRFNYTDDVINTIIKANNGKNSSYTLHYDQNENFFIKLKDSFVVPHFPIHHDVRQTVPSEEYLTSLRTFLSELIPKASQIFSGTKYFFDPAEILCPCFFQLFRIKDKPFLYFIQLNLVFKTHDSVITEAGSNDMTPEYRSNNLFFERDLIPLERTDLVDGKIRAFRINQTISDTWIGETGRGYFMQGIWIDDQLTKFFSKLLLPKGRRTYPFYPFTCKYRTVCNSLLLMDQEGRKKHLQNLVKAMEFILPEIETIQKVLREHDFSEKMEYFVKLKETVDPDLESFWSSVKVNTYLNSQNMKEFSIDF